MALTRNSTFTDPQIENEFQYLFKNCDFNNVEVDLKVKNGKYLYLYSPDNTESIYIYHNGSDVIYQPTTGSHLFLGGHALYVYDTTNADFLKSEHDGTDGIVSTNAGNVKLAPTAYVVLSSSKTTTGDPSGEEGMLYINTFDNAVRMYADGAWRDLTSW